MECSHRYKVEDLIYAMFLAKENLKKFLVCYNEQHTFLKNASQINRLPVKVDFKLKKLTGKSKRDFDRSEKFKKLLDSILNAKYDYEAFFEYQKELSSYQNILARLFESYIFIKQSNMNRAKILLLKIVKRDFAYHVFNSKVSYFKVETQIEYFKSILAEIGLYFEGQPEFQNLIYYLIFNSTGKFKAALTEQFKLDFKLNKLRDAYHSYSFGRKYPFVWAPIIFEESSLVEYKKVLEISDLSKKIATPEELLFYRELESVDRKAKNSVLKNFKKLQKSTDLYSKFLQIRLMEDDFLFNYLLANEIKFKKILAANKRSFYKSLLTEGTHVKLAILNLMELGDIQKDYLQILFEHENNSI